MQPIVPTIARTGDPTTDRNNDSIWQAFRRLSDQVGTLIDAITSDTYKVKVDASQTAVYAESALAAGAGISITKSGTTPSKVLTIDAHLSTLWSYLVACDIDFTAEPDQTIAGDGAVTVAGISAYVANHGNSSAFAVQNGVGLYIRCSTANSGTTQTGPCIYFPLNNILAGMGLELFSDIWLLFNIETVVGPDRNYETNYVGFLSGPSGGLGGTYSNTTTTYAAAVSEFASTTYGDTHYAQGILKVYQLVAVTVGGGVGGPCAPNTYDCFAVRLQSRRAVSTYYGNMVGGEWPDLEDLNFADSGTFMATGAGALSMAFRNLSVMIACSETGTGGRSDILCKKMKVFYR